MRSIRRSIFITTVILIMIGIVMIYSSSAIYAYEKFGDSTFFLKKHLLFLLIGCGVLCATMCVDLSRVERLAKPLVIFSLLLLALVLLPRVGASVGGARRWFRMGPLSFQPTELGKLSLILYLASFLDRKGYRIKDLRVGYLPAVAVVSVMSLLVLLQPDFGMAVTIVTIGFLIIYIGGARLKHLVSTALMGLPFLYYLIFAVPYRRNRILVFLNPWRDTEGAGFQIIQSFLALGSGGIFGVGLGQSKQKLFYLPESHTDFIFSIIGEELGFAGAACVLILFGIFLVQGMRAFFRAERTFNKLIIFGVTALVSFEALVNIGVSVGAFPTKGLPLPFISYGGSSLVFHMAAVGLMLNAMRDSVQVGQRIA